MCDDARASRWNADVTEPTRTETVLGRSRSPEDGVYFTLMKNERATRGKVRHRPVGVSDLLMRVKAFNTHASVCHSGSPSFDRARQMVNIGAHVACCVVA